MKFLKIWYVEKAQMSLVNFGPVGLFSETESTNFFEETLENVDNLHTISVIYKCLYSNQQTSEALYGFKDSKK